MVTMSPEGVRTWATGTDPLHEECDAPIRWTTVNLAEAFPGVPTPLTWTVIGPVFEAMARGGWVMIGAIPRAQGSIPPQLEDRYITIFHGRPVFSLDAWRRLGDSMPGTSGDAVETQIFGAKMTGAVSKTRWSRYPIVGVKMPLAGRRSRRTMMRLVQETDAWWRTTALMLEPASDSSVAADASRSDLLELISEAQRRITVIGAHHTVLSMLAFAGYERVRLLAAKLGLPGLETALLGSEGTEESRTVEDVWALSREQLTEQEFLSRHGFHGPAEGEISTPSWRQDPTPVRSLVATYRSLGDDAAPLAVRSGKIESRDAAEAQLLGAAGPLRRPFARAMLKMARKYGPLRELGRCTFLKAIDVARFASAALGEQLAADGVIRAPGDVYYLTLQELSDPPTNTTDLVATRRAERERYGTLELPDVFTGYPEAALVTVPEAASGDGPAVTGLGVSSGVVEGRVRRIVELGDDDVEPGEILVCRTTDPGWASYFFVAAGIVIDVGGPISHGAIVARELGIPCVINTRTGTARLQTGDLVRVDGTTGTVEVLEESPS